MSFVIKIDDIYCCERVVVVVRVPRRRRRRRRHIFSLSLSFERGLEMCGLFFYSSKAFKALSLVQTKGPTKIHIFDTLNCKTLNVMAIFFAGCGISLSLSSLLLNGHQKRSTVSLFFFASSRQEDHHHHHGKTEEGVFLFVFPTKERRQQRAKT